MTFFTPKTVESQGEYVPTSDNKYVQYRYMGATVTGTPNPFLDTTNWQGVDKEPTPGSHNLIESGGVFKNAIVENPIITGEYFDINVEFADGYYYKEDSIIPQSNELSKYTASKINIGTFNRIKVVALTYNAPNNDKRSCLILDENENILAAQKWGGPESTTNKVIEFNLDSIVGAKYMLISYSTVSCPNGVKVSVSFESITKLKNIELIENEIFELQKGNFGIELFPDFSNDYYYKADSVVPQSNAGSKYTDSSSKIDISSYGMRFVKVIAPSYQSAGSDKRACLILDANNNILQAKTWAEEATPLTTNRTLRFDLSETPSAKYLLLSYIPLNCTNGIKVYLTDSDYASIAEISRELQILKAEENKRYAHISFDDISAPFQYLSDNYDSVTSIFEESFFSLLKTIHDAYGVVFTLNCFVSGGLSSLANKGNKFRNDFQNNADWLKFAFHAYGAGDSYDPNTTHTYRSTASEDYAEFVTCIETITNSLLNLHQVTRLGYYEGSENNLLNIRNTYMGCYGFLCSDDSLRNSYYLGLYQSRLVRTRGHWYDAKNNLYFISTQPYRFDSDVDVTQNEAEADAETKINAITNGFVEVLMHQNTFFSNISTDTLYNSRGNIILDAVCGELKKQGYIFAFTQQNLKNL